MPLSLRCNFISRIFSIRKTGKSVIYLKDVGAVIHYCLVWSVFVTDVKLKSLNNPSVSKL